MTLKTNFKVQMTSFHSQKLWFGHLALYYDYFLTPWINSRCLLQRVTAISPKALEMWIYLTYGVMMVRKRTRSEWKFRCAFSIWTKSANSPCGEQQFTAVYFIKKTQSRSRTRTFRKSGPWTFRISGSYTKIYCMSWRLIWGCWFQIWQ